MQHIEARDLAWPWWLPAGTTFGAVFIAGEVVRSRANEYGGGVLGVAVPLAVLAVLPFVADLASHSRERFFMPRLVWAALVIGPVVALLVGSPRETDFAPFLLVIMCIQGASTARTGEALAMTFAACACLVGLEIAGEFDATAIWIIGNLAGFSGGFSVRRTVEALTAERALLSEQMEKAAVDERQRIAREIHDVIAHSLSVTLLHLTGARRALETGGDAADAAEALRDAERLGREAMNDIRRTVGILAPGAGGDSAPMPGAGDIATLAADFAFAGLDVRFEISGDPSSIPLATGLGLYRIAQEALSNVAKHAPSSSARVALDAQTDPIRLSVHNGASNGSAPIDDAPDVGGLGVQGMEARTRLLGGAFRAGPEGAGWLVCVEVPREMTER